MAKNNIFIHKSSFIDEGVKIGNKTKIWHFSHIMGGAVLGKNCVVGQNVFIGKNVKIGNNVKIQNNVSVYAGVELQDNVFCGPSVVFTNVKKPRSEYPVNKKYNKTLLKAGASIGANATIICGISIGRYAFIGAGSVVTKDIPDFALVYGNPARQHGWVCRCLKEIKNDIKIKEYICSRCKKRYNRINNKLIEI